ncbi:MAG: zinc-dependent alcohol dehydrogenase [Candidatus Nanopelagicales bacterium]
MKAVIWEGPRQIAVADVPDPKIEEPTDAIIKVTSSGICGSDLHLYEALGPFMTPGDVMGHEPMGEVLEVGDEVTHIKPGDRVVIPFNISCGHCYMCDHGLQSQCETTQNTEHGTGASLLGYTKLYGQVPGGQAEYLRVPMAHYGPIPVPEGPPDDRFVYLSDVLPTAWQAVAYADVPQGGSVAVVGLGPIGDMATRVAMKQGAGTVIGIDRVPERLARAQRNGVAVINADEVDDVGQAVREMTQGRGADSAIDAVGMEAHGNPVVRTMRATMSLLPDTLTEKLMRTAGIDQLAALMSAFDMVRRGGTVSISGVYGGMADPMPMLTLFDKQVTIRMGQANVRRWLDDILPLVSDDTDPLGLESFATHHLLLDEAPQAYKDFASKKDGMVKVLLRP